VAILDIDGAAERADELGAGAIGVRADVTDMVDLQAGVDEVVSRLGGIDVLVANARIGPSATTVAAGDRAHQRQVLDVNLHGVWHTMWAAADHVVARQGHIVIISSIAAFVLTPSWAAYSASKAAVEQLARSMRVELAPTRTTVGVAHFGLVDTELVRAFEADPISAAMESLAPSPVSTPVTANSAAAALVRDIEHRRPRTVHPAWWRPFYGLRGVLGPLSDAVVVRHPGVRRLMLDTLDRDRTTRQDA
jgi:NAD(P)-dependent dehydrogenase (short-subunit alcohol dehydrogenase family)